MKNLILIIIFIVIPIYFCIKQNIEGFTNTNPYYSPKKTLKQMISHMCYDALNDNLKPGSLLLNLPKF